MLLLILKFGTNWNKSHEKRKQVYVEKTMRQDGATNENKSALSSWKRNWQWKWLLSAGETYRATGYDIQFFTIWRLEQGFLDRKSLEKSVEAKNFFPKKSNSMMLV